ncbi:zinc metalloprotease HtpX [Methanoculleus sp. Wushi-C6]|uniref:Protease HtpX homolog n=1 Tax=Methanoculleus caldifontis TaxID=2651577 RepID=A0ABU3WYE2_9EURY|nr:zinc metalloprotease HtpX [Methanoculleus sp. Wushi-C6]MDV2480823.1 zinc metalloprotease HtpX [Methanoculleus sp. Wushi-C6]
MKWTRDFGLTMRMVLTSFLLLIVYLIFLGVLAALGFPFEFLLLVAAGMAFLQFFFSDKLVLWSTGTRLIEEDEYPELHRMVESLAARADLPKPKIGIMASPVPNAFATGRSPSNAVVAVTDSIMRVLNREELEAVLAHELAHVKNRDMLTLTMASFISMLAYLIMQNWIFMGLFGNRDSQNNGMGALVLVYIVSIVVWIVSTLLTRALSRYREFSADRGSAEMTDNPRALISALQKISGRMDYIPAEKKREVEGANAFFIIPALSGNTLMELFSTHPPLEKRVAALEELAAGTR